MWELQKRVIKLLEASVLVDEVALESWGTKEGRALSDRAAKASKELSIVAQDLLAYGLNTWPLRRPDDEP
jgi:hypothetical protein